MSNQFDNGQRHQNLYCVGESEIWSGILSEGIEGSPLELRLTSKDPYDLV